MKVTCAGEEVCVCALRTDLSIGHTQIVCCCLCSFDRSLRYLSVMLQVLFRSTSCGLCSVFRRDVCVFLVRAILDMLPNKGSAVL